MASDWEGVSFAPDGTIFDPAPTWERLDAGVEGLRCAGVDLTRGRSSAFEQTSPGEYTFTFNDRLGVLDPTNAAGPWYGKFMSRPIAVAIRNPMTDEWWPLGRFKIKRAVHGFNKSQLVRQTVITAVDLFDYFANFELIPGLAGFSNAQVNSNGYVFYEDAGFDERILALLGDCGITDSALYSVFTGNIICCESQYASGDKMLQALQEAVDAEFPTVANQYIDIRGRYQAHGRYARFDPDGVAADATNWDFNRWKAGDNAAAFADTGPTGTAKLQEPYAFSEDVDLVRNAALAYPAGTDQSDLADYIYEDAASQLEHGVVTWTAPNLQLARETTLDLTAKQASQLYAQYIIENYKQPHPTLEAITIGTEHPEWPSAEASWNMICRADISDIVAVTIDHPGAGGFSAEEYFIEGRRDIITPGPGSLDDSFPIITTTFNLTPQSRWANNPFGDRP